jgi:hypothetical protein
MPTPALPNVQHLIADLRFGLWSFPEALRFMRTHRLWTGFWQYGWLSRLMLVFAIWVGLKYGALLLGLFSRIDVTNPSSIGAGMADFVGDLLDADSGFLLGGMKYLVLVLAEVLIFHIVRRTVELLTGEEQDNSFSSFVKAQVRMFKVVLYAWIMELILRILISIAFGIFQIDFLVEPIMWVVQFYFLGFAVLDNYNEIYGMKIQDSAKRIYQVAGASVAIGAGTYLLMLIPVAGPFIGPMLAAVAGTLLMYEREQDGRLPAIEVIVKEETTLSKS